MSVAEGYRQKIETGELRPDPVQADAVAMLDAFGIRLADATQPGGIFSRLLGKSPELTVKGLYIWGGVGRGKSMLMDLFYDRCDMTRKRRLHFLEFMQIVHRQLHEVRKTNARDAIVPVAAKIGKPVDLLCIDEFQISDIADGVIVGRLLEQLFKLGVVIVTTSNRPPEDLCKDGLNRHLFIPYARMLEEKLTLYRFGGSQDYRRQRISGQKTYFWPVNDEAARTVRAIWEDLSGGHSETLTLEINKREIFFPRFSNGTLYSGFWELCGQPLGPQDFLAIAENIKVMILEGIPVLSRSNYNEARRFVMLVDALYEARVDLIATAVDRPEYLYIEGTGSFEFERTASRLREMQGSNWGKG